MQARFSELEAALGDERLEGGALADLGVSSMQLERPERGFSLQQDGPLDMRMSGGDAAVDGDDTGGGEVSAFDLVNEAPEGQLQKIFSELGEERMARRIAQTIASARVQQPIQTTRELRDLVYRAKGGRRKEGRIDSATRVFQALRIAVNEELQELERLLGQAVRLLRPDGRLVVISYHSLEDRVVKHRLKSWADPLRDPTTGRQREEERLVELITKKALRPSERSRPQPPGALARLRAARKLG